MKSSNSIIRRTAVKAKSVMLLGTAVVGTLLMSFTTVERGEVPVENDKAETVKVETVQVQAVGHHNLDKVVKALTIIDPTWAKSLPKTKARKRKEEEAARKGAGNPSEEAEGAQPTQYVFFPGTSDTNCNAINLNQYMGPSNPPTIPEGVNPEGCDGGNLCCGKAYPAANVQYNPVTNRWEPTSETGVQYFQKSL